MSDSTGRHRPQHSAEHKKVAARRPLTPERPESQIYEQAREAADAILSCGGVTPRVALVLGSGLGEVADAIESVSDAVVVPYDEIPYFPLSTVVGHAGRLVLGTLRGVPVVALRGRFHLYEGYTPQQVVFPVRVLKLLGVETLLLTNAAGGLAPTYTPGTLMLLRDSIGLPMLAGMNPLIGPNDDRLGPRFPPMTHAYDASLRRMAREVAAAANIAVEEGVYAMVAGPSYESRAELRLLRMAGADAVGMSTVPEVIAARHLGMRVLAVSCITNQTLPENEAEATMDDLSHEEVIVQAVAAGPRLATLLEGVVARIGSSAATGAM